MSDEREDERGGKLEKCKRLLDEQVKKVFSQRWLLAWLLKTCLEEYKECDLDAIAEQYLSPNDVQVGSASVVPGGAEAENPLVVNENTVDEIPGEGRVTYDVKCTASLPGDAPGRVGLILNIEVQKEHSPGYSLKRRGIFYGARLLSSQYGTYFSHSRYNDLRKVCSIWICFCSPIVFSNSIVRYQLEETVLAGGQKASASTREEYDLLSVYMVYLNRKTPFEENAGLFRLLRTVLFQDRPCQERLQILKNEFGFREPQEKGEIIMCNFSDVIFEQGEEKGWIEGEKFGRAEGEKFGRTEGGKVRQNRDEN